ncbi:MAG: site-specific integrase [Desulfatiglans sp.]|nr:site-specific integrase [Desulfatiglans sp.]
MACIKKRRGRWVIDFYDQHGKRRWSTLKEGATKTEANKVMQDILKQVDHGSYLPDKKIPSFEKVAEQWLKNKKISLREHTFDAYECHVRRNLQPFFGTTKITWINYPSITKFISYETERGASIPHIKKSLIMLNGIMKYAVRQRYIDYNPVQDVEKPKGHSRYNESDEMDIFRPDEIRQLFDNTEGLKYKTLFMVAVMSGARQGEILGLKWADIDWYNSQLIIKRTFQHGRFYEPKSETSKRKIDIGPTVMTQLKKWKLASKPNDLDLVFSNEEGMPIDKNNLVKRYYEPALRRAGLRRIRFHDLRHTFASLLIDQGEHPKYIQNQLGHSSINVTMDVYGHLMNTVNQESAKRLDSVIFKNNGSNLVANEEKAKVINL